MTTNKTYFLLFLVIAGFNSACTNEEYKKYSMDDSTRATQAGNMYSSMVTQNPQPVYAYNSYPTIPAAAAPAFSLPAPQASGEQTYSYYSSYDIFPERPQVIVINSAGQNAAYAATSDF